jgi:hypothetical protein
MAGATLARIAAAEAARATGKGERELPCRRHGEGAVLARAGCGEVRLTCIHCGT